MTAKRQVVVRIDGNTSNSSLNRDKFTNKTDARSHNEMAAAEESGENDIHTFAREYDSTLAITKSGKKSQTNFDIFKPIIIAIVSAVTIGSIMGFVMLKIIVNFDNDLNGTPAVLVPTDGEKKKDNGAATDNANKGTYILESMSAFVLQGGVFSSLENAEAESSKFIENGYNPVIWEKDSQFFLLVHLGLTKEDLQDDTSTLMTNGIEAYAKEWQIVEKEVEVSKEEYEWLASFQDNWNISLGEGKVDKTKWNNLLEQAPSNSTILTNLTTSVKDQLDALDTRDHNQILLALWQSFHNTLSN
ncbi:hypothetical protein [Ornithinibacillus scapharcae]|uniref:hypothetical protein n=1 Tax=Ornithinibacillus scapharcae TaxID=1147159 RepID=UPI000225BF53|nr:hypothetical protein [Ornithinibacillus scapharcae]